MYLKCPRQNNQCRKCDRLSDEDGPLQGSPDWLIEIRSPDQSTIELQNKILHCLSNGTQLAWFIDIQRKQIWVWENQELPLVYSETDTLPTLGNISELTVETAIAMTQQR
ncbi:Uma2 family endonuclease [Nodularia sp. LEGE 06071]|nr:Uma2 family endonuclease [Nodularia sp. LEGE 06071]MCC2694937.1 Uma2 family endonuclease [Nodularia sp. LEGE 04288]